jgi:hypothetical protein
MRTVSGANLLCSPGVDQILKSYMERSASLRRYCRATAVGVIVISPLAYSQAGLAAAQCKMVKRPMCCILMASKLRF